MPITHTTVATGVNDPSKQVSKDAWNATHTSPLISDVTGLQAVVSGIVPMALNNRLAVMGTSAVANPDAWGYLLPLVEPRLQRTRDCAGSGQNTTWMANRYNTNVLNWKPGFVLIDAGKNDLGTAYQRTVYMIEETRKIGAIALVATTYGYPVTESQGANAYNAALKAYCNPANGVDGPGATDPGIVFLDTYSTMFNANGTNKFPLKQSNATGTNLTGATVIKVVDASQFTAGTGQFVWSATFNIAKPCVILARDTVSSPNTITISRPLGSDITAGTAIYSHPYFNDSDHTSGTGSMVFVNYALGVINAAGLLNTLQKPRAPIGTVSAAERTGGAIENIYGRFATMEGTVTNGLHEGLQTQLGAGNYSVTTDSRFRGKVQNFTIPAGTAAGTYFCFTDSSFFPNIENLAGRLVGFHAKYEPLGWQNAGALYSFECDGGKFGHFPQFPMGLTSDFPMLFRNDQQITDGLQEVWGVGYMPTDAAESSAGFSIQTAYAVPAGVTPPTFKIGELGFWDIDDPQLPRRWNPRSVTLTATGTVSPWAEVVWINAAGTTNITLPTAAGNGGTVEPQVHAQQLKLINIGAGTATLIGTIDGVSNPTLASGASKTINWDTGTSWRS